MDSLITSALEILEIPFYGSTLTAIKGANGVNYAAPKRICEGLGIDWDSQRAKLREHPVIGPTTVLITVVAQDGKSREMVGLPVDMVPGWLLNINPSRVSPENRDALLRYQREAFGVLSKAFLPKEALAPTKDWSGMVPQTLSEALRLAADLNDKVEAQAKQIAEDAPKVEAFESWMDSEGNALIRNVGKAIPKLKMGQNRLYQALREKGVIIGDTTEPYQKWVDAGYFVQKPRTWFDPKAGVRRPSFTTMVTPSGIEFIRRLFAKSEVALA